jgi:predicted RNA methylase
MWRQIKKRVKFKDKTVLDLGCGYGDFMHFALMAGASFVTGVERDIMVAASASGRLTDFGYAMGKDFLMSSEDIDDMVSENLDGLTINDAYDSDIIMCFSCLPYLMFPEYALQWMRRHSDITLIECQYADDGPGFSYIKNDDDMIMLLAESGWHRIARTGRTHARIRDSYRTIWACYS